MEYRTLSGFEVSLLGFGCMRLPQKGGKIDEAEAKKIVDAAFAGGINYFDTAWPYHDGKSEAFVGDALSAYPRDSYYIATKLPCWEVKSSADAERIFAEQLRRLRTDHVDFYMMHALNGGRWDEMESLGIFDLLDSWRAAGRIRRLGFSFHDGYPAFEKIVRAKRWDFCQIQYNYMDEDEQAGTKGYALAESLGVPVIVMEPLKGGSLAMLPADVLSPFKAIDPEASSAAWSFRWLSSHPGVRLILSGMSTMEQLEENLRIFADFRPFGAAENRAVADVSASVRARARNGCTACGYCMPCPSGVDIPRNFGIWNSWGMYRNPGDARWQWHNPDFAASRADKCVSCGLCAPKCPQKIDIPGDLAKVREELEAVKRVTPKRTGGTRAAKRT